MSKRSKEKRTAPEMECSRQYQWNEDVTVAAGRWEAVKPETSLRATKQKHFSAGEVIYHERDSVDSVYAIGWGLVKLLSYLPNGRARIVRLHGKGDWVGLEALLQQPYEHTAVAVYDVDVYCIPTQRLHLSEQDDPQYYYRFMEKWHGHLREADMWISDFSTGPIKSRVARLINFLSRLQYGNSSAMVKLLTCDEMATVLGVTPESVSRHIAEFKRRGILHSPSTPSPELYERNVKELEQVALK
jgi:CRP/FNR family transcriptional regulator